MTRPAATAGGHDGGPGHAGRGVDGPGTHAAEGVGPDLRSAVVTGAATLAWYAVPDVVGPRWARALAKVAVLASGLGVGLAVTAEGRAARAGVRAAAEDPAGDPTDGVADGAAGDEAPRGGQVAPALAAGAVVGALGITGALAVAGERWAYRRGERWRERGLALPHTRVGLVLGALAAGLTLLEPRSR